MSNNTQLTFEQFLKYVDEDLLKDLDYEGITLREYYDIVVTQMSNEHYYP
jgi:Uma2 family endonuclease